MIRTYAIIMEEKTMSETDFLFARPSFLEGMARVLDLGCTLNSYNASRNGADADRRALSSDFKMIGKDIAAGIGHYEQQKQEEPKR
jgi:hypothetical protein